jgi:three-Cys-motif partner protein
VCADGEARVSEAEDKSGLLFDLGKPTSEAVKLVGRPRHPVWTEQKALFIKRYMQLFVMVTKCGTYIDAFAGPQYPAKPEMWAANLVLENRPKLLRHFYFFETDPNKFPQLADLVAGQELPYGRTIKASPLDCNLGIRELLAQGVIADKEPTFALLDQHSTECDWETVRALASHKAAGHHKIELFYFLANGWLGRTLANTKDEDSLDRWWGSRDWTKLRAMRSEERGQMLAARFERELGYACATPYPIYDEGSQVMYFLVHATDHPKAQGLMTRAYRNVHKSDRSWEEEQRPLLARYATLLSNGDGSYVAKCARCSSESASVSGTIATVVDKLVALRWTSVHETKWICPTCEGKPLPPAPRAPRKKRK